MQRTRSASASMPGVHDAAGVARQVDLAAPHRLDRARRRRRAVVHEARPTRPRGRGTAARPGAGAGPRPSASGRCCPCTGTGRRCGERSGAVPTPDPPCSIRPAPQARSRSVARWRSACRRSVGRLTRRDGVGQRGPMDPRLPVLIGGGQVNQRDGDGDLEPVGLMAEALRRAAADAGVADPSGLLAAADTIAAVNVISWRYRDPASLVAGLLGAAPARTWYTTAAGSSPQALLSRAARRHQRRPGRPRARSAAARRGGPGCGCARRTAAPTGPCSPRTWRRTGRSARGSRRWSTTTRPGAASMMPVQVYPLFESALRAAAGRTQEEHLVHVSELWAGFSAVASTNPDAWIQRALHGRGDPHLRARQPPGRLAVPQAHELEQRGRAGRGGDPVLGRAGRGARACRATAGCSRGPAPTPTTRRSCPTGRPSPGRRPSASAGRTTFRWPGSAPTTSPTSTSTRASRPRCRSAAAELGLGTDRPLTVTGGLSFAGGPWNNYVGHSLATMQRVLREDAWLDRARDRQRRVPHEARARRVLHRAAPRRLVPLGVGAGGDRRGRLGRAERRLAGRR